MHAYIYTIHVSVLNYVGSFAKFTGDEFSKHKNESYALMD